jgi:hypothetical protein
MSVFLLKGSKSMCFSPQASFGAAAVLSVLGIAGLRKTAAARRSHSIFDSSENEIERRSRGLIAAVPCIFAVQQALEGFVWLALGRGDYNSAAYYVPVYAYLFFAGVWWPLYIPTILWYLEENSKRKKLIIGAIIAGCVVALISLVNFFAGPVTVSVVDHHIAYQLKTQFPFSSALYYVSLICYLIAISGALFLSTVSYASTMGWLVLLAFAAAHMWYYLAFGSVWCFFAAICSALIVLVLE